MSNLVLTEDDARLLFKEYCNFLVLHVATREDLCPPMLIEALWSIHMGFTREYREFCRRVFTDTVLPKVYSFD